VADKSRTVICDLAAAKDMVKGSTRSALSVIMVIGPCHCGNPRPSARDRR